MLTFPITAFKIETVYPESSVRLQFGKSWTFTAPPDAPDQRTFKLYLTGMKYYVDENKVIDEETNASINNLAVLDNFYQEVRMYTWFNFNHPVYGTLVCSFNKPLTIPKGVEGGNGVVEDFEVELLEQP